MRATSFLPWVKTLRSESLCGEFCAIANPASRHKVTTRPVNDFICFIYIYLPLTACYTTEGLPFVLCFIRHKFSRLCCDFFAGRMPGGDGIRCGTKGFRASNYRGRADR